MSAFSGANETTYKYHVPETTEFEDILVKKGIISERAEITIDRMVKEELRKRGEAAPPSAEEQLGAMGADELDEAEDDFDADLVAQFRQQRLAEMRARAAGERFGEVLPLVRADFVREVTEASHECWVVTELYQNSVRESGVIEGTLHCVSRHTTTALTINEMESVSCELPPSRGRTTCAHAPARSLAR